jgi:RNA 3'-terminal phosphate cyclase (ATP)
MALAAGESRVLSGPITLHTETAIRLAEMLTGASFQLIPSFPQGTFEIRCQGIGFKIT